LPGSHCSSESTIPFPQIGRVDDAEVPTEFEGELDVPNVAEAERGRFDPDETGAPVLEADVPAVDETEAAPEFEFEFKIELEFEIEFESESDPELEGEVEAETLGADELEGEFEVELAPDFEFVFESVLLLLFELLLELLFVEVGVGV